MTVDYYELLQVPRNAKDDDLKKAAEAKLKEISDAYHVLSDPRKRAEYDKHGEEGLKREAPPPWMAGHYDRSPDHIFSEFFKESGSAGYDGGVRRKAAPIEKTLPCSLEELYKGTTKRLNISRDVLSATGRRSTVEEVLTIEIKPGWKKGTQITFMEKGNDVEQGVIPADVIVIIDEQPHSLFQRNGDDLIATRNISLVQALTSYMQLTSLDGRILVPTRTLTSLNHEAVLKGEGMPNQKEKSKRGNLIFKLNIEFPKLTSLQQTEIERLLKSQSRW